MMGVEFTMTKEQFKTYLLSQGNTCLDYFLKYNPELDIKNTSCPVFVLNGDKDIQVISALNIPAFDEILPEHK